MPRTITTHETYIGADQSALAPFARAFHIIDGDTRVTETAPGVYTANPKGGYLAVSGVRQLLKSDAEELNALTIRDFITPKRGASIPEVPGSVVVVHDDQLGATIAEWTAERERLADEHIANREGREAAQAKTDAAIDQHRDIARRLTARGINADVINTDTRQVTLSFDSITELLDAIA